MGQFLLEKSILGNLSLSNIRKVIKHMTFKLQKQFFGRLLTDFFILTDWVFENGWFMTRKMQTKDLNF